MSPCVWFSMAGIHNADKMFLILPVLLRIPSLLNSSRHLYCDSVMIWCSPSIIPIAGARKKSAVGSTLGSAPLAVVIHYKRNALLMDCVNIESHTECGR